MVRLIVTTVLIVLLAVLVVFNLKFTTSISLYGFQLTDVPAMAVALISFALGVVYSLFLYVGKFMHERSRQRLDKRSRDITLREQKLSGTETAVAAGEPSAAPPIDGGGAAATGQPRRRFRLFRRAHE